MSKRKARVDLLIKLRCRRCFKETPWTLESLANGVDVPLCSFCVDGPPGRDRAVDALCRASQKLLDALSGLEPFYSSTDIEMDRRWLAANQAGAEPLRPRESEGR